MSRTDIRRVVQQSLAAASAALLDGDTRGMAEQLLKAWRLSCDPGIAALYEVLLCVPAQPLPGRNSSERVRAWREAVSCMRGDPSVLPSLLDEPSHPDMPEIDRLMELAAWTPNPL